MTKVKRYFDLLASVAVIAAASLVIGVIVKAHFKAKNGNHYPEALRKGSVLAQIQGVDLSGSPRTLILALSTNCRYCSASTPFYRQLIQGRDEARAPIRMIAVFSEPQDQAAAYLGQHQLDVPSAAGADYRKIGIPLTPSLILVDSNGEIINSWIGQLTEDEEKDVYREVVKPSASERAADPRYVNTERTVSLFDEGRPVLTIRPDPPPYASEDPRAEMAARRMINYFSVDPKGNIYVAANRSILKYDPSGRESGSIPWPEGFMGAFCVDGDEQLYLPARNGIHVYSAALSEARTIPASRLPYGEAGLVLKTVFDDGEKSIYIQVYDPKQVTQTLYRFNPETTSAVVLHRQQNQVKFSPTFSPGAFDFAVGKDYLYVSDIYEYKIYLYSRRSGQLARVFTKPSPSLPIDNNDGHLANRKITVGDLTGPGLKNYPPVLHLSFTGTGNLLAWTSQRDSTLRQKVDVYDPEMHFVGVDMKYAHPGISNYVFVNNKIYVPDFGFGRVIPTDSVSPLEVPSKPLGLKVFDDSFKRI